MPELELAVLADFVRQEGGLGHLVAANVDTVTAPQVPAGRNFGLFATMKFTRNECGRPHRFEVFFQDIDGNRLAEISSVIEAQWDKTLPVGWRTTGVIALNIGLPLPAYGEYAIEILVNDEHRKTLNLRVIAPPAQPDAPEA